MSGQSRTFNPSHASDGGRSMLKQRGVSAVEPPAATDQAPATCKLVYILGAGHSGSTLLSRLLGEVPGFFNAGEAGYNLFTKEQRDAEETPCGCGKPSGECSFWAEIISGVPSRVRPYWRQVERLGWSRRMLLALRGRRQTCSEDAVVASAMAAIYHRIATKANCMVVVDASKSATVAALLTGAPGIELYTVHLVRHPFGLVDSFSRTGEWLPRVMPMFECVLKACWFQNVMFELVKGRAYWYRTLLYEDLVRNPASTLNGLVGQILSERVEMPFLRGRVATLGFQHDLEGNGRVPRSGNVEIRPAEVRLRRWERHVVWLTTFPLLWHYGYFSNRM